MERQQLFEWIDQIRSGSTMAIEPLCAYVEHMITPFDKQTWQREYMREYRRGLRRRQSTGSSA